MPLTRLIDDRHGPVRLFFEEQLPHRATYRDRWRAAGPPAIRPPAGTTNLGVVGGAIDYRVRYLFDCPDPRGSVGAYSQVGYGVEETEETILAQLEGRHAFGNLAAAIDELTNRANPDGRQLDEPDKRALCELCCLLAMYDTVARIGLSPTSPLAPLAFDASVEDQLAVLDRRWVDDVVQLVGGVVTTLGHLVGQPVKLGPLFKGSAEVQGADADLIVGRTLLEVKTTTQAQRPEWLYQLVGYLLLDYDNRHDIEEIGFVLPRVPALVTWPVDELLASLAGRPVDRDELRVEFRAAVAAATRRG